MNRAYRQVIPIQLIYAGFNLKNTTDATTFFVICPALFVLESLLSSF